MNPDQRLVLVRHGRTDWNAEGRFQGQADPPLDDFGWEQARRAASSRCRPSQWPRATSRSSRSVDGTSPQAAPTMTAV